MIKIVLNFKCIHKYACVTCYLNERIRLNFGDYHVIMNLDQNLVSLQSVKFHAIPTLSS